jgi:hypothetical protein
VAVLNEALEACLRNGRASFTSEALFNRLIIELWERRALGCLKLDRREFAAQLQQRGWSYDEKRHVWERNDGAGRTDHELELALK